MKEFVEKLIERLEEEGFEYQRNNKFAKVIGIDLAIEIVNQFAEEYKDKTNDAWKTVYDKVCNLEKEYAIKNNTESINDCIRLENLLQYFKDELRSTEEHKGGWIPCSERLPEDCGDVICTVKVKDKANKDILFLWYNAETKYWYYLDDDQIKGIDVIAWMPLPEPYQKGE